MAASRGFIASVNALLEAGADVDSGDPLSLATSPVIIKILLEAGATVDQPHKSRLDGQRTPLHMAASNGKIETANFPLAAGADPSFTGGYHNNTPAQAARLSGSIGFADVAQAVADEPTTRPTPESAGLDTQLSAPHIVASIAMANISSSL